MPQLHKCERCDEEFDTVSKKKHHQLQHVEKILYGPDNAELLKDKDGHFWCPVCSGFLKNLRIAREHLQKHDVQVEFVYTPPKRSSDNGTNGSQERRVLDDASNTKDSNEDGKTTTNVPVIGSENDSKIIFHNPSTDSEDTQDKRRCTDTIEHPELKRQRITDMKAHQMDHDTAILASSDGLFINDRERQLRLAIAGAGNWCPVVYTGYEDESHALLSSSKGVSYLLAKEDGLWKLPMSTHLHTSYSIPNEHHRIDYLKQFGPTSEFLKKNNYQELDEATVEMINADWILEPATPYIFAQVFVGAILINSTSALLVNCVEPYGRQRCYDAHFERQLPGSESSYPEGTSKYGDINITLVMSEQNTKLVCGTTTANILVTSSSRLDIPNTTNMGPFTSNFTPDHQTLVFVDERSLRAAQALRKRKNVEQVQGGPAFASIRQLRSKFSHISTYMRTRASSKLASALHLRPSTIWTVSDYDSPQQGASQERIGSKVFQHIAQQVMKKGEEGGLELKFIKHTIAEFPNSCAAKKILNKILTFFPEDVDTILIIGNESLNTQLTLLADIVSKANHTINTRRLEAINLKLYNKV